VDDPESIPSVEIPSVEVRLVDGPITAMLGRDSSESGPDSRPLTRVAGSLAAGAMIRFEGRVRPNEPSGDGQQRVIAGLRYEVYEPMTTREMSRLGRALAVRHGVLGVLVQHSYGFVEVGECSFLLQVFSRHRAEGIMMMDEFITRMKQQVPIWKVPKWAANGRQR